MQVVIGFGQCLLHIETSQKEEELFMSRTAWKASNQPKLKHEHFLFLEIK